MKLIYIISFFILSFFHNTAFAADYTFTGNGNWNDPNNWEGGIIPPGNLPGGSQITINGTAYVGIGCGPGTIGPCSDPGTFGGINNGGTLIISAGGSLALQNYTQFSHQGSMIVNGTLTINTTFEGYSVGSVTVNGILVNKKIYGNQGLVTINNGGIINNEALFTNTGWNNFDFPIIGTLVINTGGTFNNSGTAFLRAGKLTNNGVVNNQSKMDGNATITGSLVNAGTLSPGNSPGTYTVTGNYTATNTSIHNFEVGGLNSSSYDKLLVGGNVNLNGTLNISLINGFIPTTDHEIKIITGTIAGNFSNVNLPGSYTIIYRTNEVVLQKFTALPVSFKAIDVKKTNSIVTIHWEVENEEGITKYEIEKSDDGRSFITIGALTASNQTNYYFNTNDIVGKTFYRIKSISNDGSINYSRIVNYNGVSTIILKLIPSDNKLIIKHSTSGKGSLINVNSIDGRLINKIIISEGSEHSEISISNLSSGAYFITYYDGNSKETIRFVK